eukprot:11051789-Lingulodinium_polyedra.AAC.1
MQPARPARQKCSAPTHTTAGPGGAWPQQTPLRTRPRPPPTQRRTHRPDANHAPRGGRARPARCRGR